MIDVQTLYTFGNLDVNRGGDIAEFRAVVLFEAEWLNQIFAGLVVLGNLQVVDIEVIVAADCEYAYNRTLGTLGEVEVESLPASGNLGFGVEELYLFEIAESVAPVEQSGTALSSVEVLFAIFAFKAAGMT